MSRHVFVTEAEMNEIEILLKKRYNNDIVFQYDKVAGGFNMEFYTEHSWTYLNEITLNSLLME